jgi:hypothetical protein
MNLHDGIRTEVRTRFDEVEGYIVEEVIAGTSLLAGQTVLPPLPQPPGQPVIVTLADVPLSLAQKVCAAHGLVVVPQSFLNQEQLAELAIDPVTSARITVDPAPAPVDKKPGKLTVAQAIRAVKTATSFEELNAITDSNTGADVLAAAEVRAAELKG